MKQKKPSFYFPKILVALVFLLTPSISLIDPLPDFIGYLLLAHALSYAADAFPYFGDAKAGFTRMMWISLSKIPAALLMLMMWGTDNAQRSIVTVFSLCYAVLDLVFLMPALRSFMEGVFYLGNRYDCESAMGVPASFGKMTDPHTPNWLPYRPVPISTTISSIRSVLTIAPVVYCHGKILRKIYGVSSLLAILHQRPDVGNIIVILKRSHNILKS